MRITREMGEAAAAAIAAREPGCVDVWPDCVTLCDPGVGGCACRLDAKAALEAAARAESLNREKREGSQQWP